MSTAQLAEAVASTGYTLGSDPLVVVGLRGFYARMGAAAGNDRGIYDDALFIHSADASASFNANTDPSLYRRGRGSGAGRGIASLVPGVWRVHKFDLHRGQYLALCQRDGPVVVLRDGDPDYQDSGYLGINIHRGGRNTTGSEGCQTVYYDQWDGFIGLAESLARRLHGARWRSEVVPYVLLDYPMPDVDAEVVAPAETNPSNQGEKGMVQLANYSAANGPLTLLLQCNFQTRGAMGIYSWTPGSGNQWTLIHGDSQWGSTSGPHVIPALPTGSKLHWIVGLITTAQPPAAVNGVVTLSQGGTPLDVVPVSGTATATQPVQAHKTYDL